MNISCIHCGDEFSITVDQLGTRGKCPHCKGTIRLPRADSAILGSSDLTAPTPWFENSLSGIVTVVIHLVIVILLAMIPWQQLVRGDWGDSQDVFIGQLPADVEVDDSLEEFDAELIDKLNEDARESLDPDLLPPTTSDDFSELEMDVNLFSPSGGVGQALDVQAFARPRIEAGGAEAFTDMITRLRRDGLDIVITFDSTASMSGEINQVKSQIRRLGTALFELVPKTRIGLCTYRDRDDQQYVVDGLPLTDNLADIVDYLDTVRAAGGGDEPEAVDAGLNWAIGRNRFRPGARKIILLFGDAPPHTEDVEATLQVVSSFNRQQQGIVSTVTCHLQQRLPEFIDLAQMGGGEAFLAEDEREIMTQLMILVFGSKHRDKVLRAFDLMEK